MDTPHIKTSEQALEEYFNTFRWCWWKNILWQGRQDTSGRKGWDPVGADINTHLYLSRSDKKEKVKEGTEELKEKREDRWIKQRQWKSANTVEHTRARSQGRASKGHG